jgi:cytochrome c55X
MDGSTACRLSRRLIPALLGALLIAPATGQSTSHPTQPGIPPASPAAQISYPDAQRQQQLMYLLAQDCGSCHGMTLQGGLGPALTPEALAGKPPVMLRDVILRGRPGTPMPPWKTFLTERDAEWLVQVLVNGLGP